MPSPLLAVALLAAGTLVLAPAPAFGGTAVASDQRPHTLVVATTGSDAAAGTANAPLRTMSEAVSRSTSGSRVVVHAGSYHESVTVPTGLDVTLEAAPGATVWLDGSRAVHRWRAAGGDFVHRGWTASFDASPTYTWGAPDNQEAGWSFVNARYPMAAHPDQVWVDGRPQRQVASRDQVRPGTFFVDERGDRLVLGTDPTGHSVRASTIAKGMSIRGAGTSVNGIGVRRFAPSVPHMGAVTVEAAGVTLRDVTARDNATTGLHVVGRHATLRRVRVLHNGMLGLSATYADGLRATKLRALGNNTERFNTSPVAGGVKVGRSRGVRLVGATVSHNAGTGIWFDESTRRVRVYGSTVRDNAKHGVSLEISDNGRVADTVIAGNAGFGVKVNDTSDVALWNNTIVGNDRPVNIVQDGRDGSDPDTPGHDPRHPAPVPGMTWVNGPVRVANNILGRGGPAATCLLCVEDYSGRFTAAQMRVRTSGNVYVRADRTSPTWVAVWSRGAGNPAVFTSVADFRRATGQEQRHLSLIGRPAVTADLRPTSVVQRAASRVAERLPSWLARVTGRPRDAEHLGAWR